MTHNFAEGSSGGQGQGSMLGYMAFTVECEGG